MKSKIVLAMTCILFLGAAQAASSVDLKVAGKLAMGACVPTFESGNIIDMGHIPVKNMIAQGTIGYKDPLYLDKKVSIDITCATEVKLGFTITDNQPGTVPGTFSTYLGAYGLGKTADDKNIGLFQLYKSDATFDGKNAALIWSKDGGKTWGADSSSLDSGNGNYMYAFAASGETSPTPQSGKNFHLRMNTNVYFDKTVVDALQDELAFQGTATFTMLYL